MSDLVVYFDIDPIYTTNYIRSRAHKPIFESLVSMVEDVEDLDPKQVAKFIELIGPLLTPDQLQYAACKADAELRLRGHPPYNPDAEELVQRCADCGVFERCPYTEPRYGSLLT